MSQRENDRPKMLPWNYTKTWLALTWTTLVASQKKSVYGVVKTECCQAEIIKNNLTKMSSWAKGSFFIRGLTIDNSGLAKWLARFIQKCLYCACFHSCIKDVFSMCVASALEGSLWTMMRWSHRNQCRRKMPFKEHENRTNPSYVKFNDEDTFWEIHI